MILVAQNIRQHLESIAFLDQSHRHARNRRLDRHAGVHEREAGAAHRSHGAQPLDSRISETTRMTYGNLSTPGMTAFTPRFARLPWPISRRFGEPIMPVSPTLKGGKL